MAVMLWFFMCESWWADPFVMVTGWVFLGAGNLIIRSNAFVVLLIAHASPSECSQRGISTVVALNEKSWRWNVLPILFSVTQVHPSELLLATLSMTMLRICSMAFPRVSPSFSTNTDRSFRSSSTRTPRASSCRWLNISAHLFVP